MNGRMHPKGQTQCWTGAKRRLHPTAADLEGSADHPASGSGHEQRRRASGDRIEPRRHRRPQKPAPGRAIGSAASTHFSHGRAPFRIILTSVNDLKPIPRPAWWRH